MKGYIGKKSFEDCLKDKSMIKLDLVYLLNGVIVEISEVYFFKIQNHTNYHDDAFNTNSIKTSIQNEIHELLKNGKYFKALKRMFSILNIENSKKPIVNKLISFFNSQTGILYKANSDLNILLTLITTDFLNLSRTSLTTFTLCQLLTLTLLLSSTLHNCIQHSLHLRELESIHALLSFLCNPRSVILHRDFVILLLLLGFRA